MFVPMRLDVWDPAVKAGKNKEGKKRVEVWQTFRGNEWGNKGERLGGGEGSVKVNVGVLTEKNFYEARSGCECLSSWPALRKMGSSTEEHTHVLLT